MKLRLIHIRPVVLLCLGILLISLVAETSQAAGHLAQSVSAVAHGVDALQGGDSAASVRFAVIGDYGADSQAEQGVADLVRSWNPDFVITLGDNNYSNGAAATIDDNIGQYYHEFIYPYYGTYGPGATINRFFPTLGNHDWRSLSCAGSDCTGPYFDYFTLPGNERYYDFSWGPVHLFAIDSDAHEPDGTSSTSAQAGWLQSTLAASTAPWQLVYMHHPPFSSGSHGSNTRMQWPYQAWGADAVLAGHDHTYERIIRDGIPYFVNGLGGASRYPFGTPVAGSQARYNADYGALLVEATDNSITFQFISRAGTVIDTYAIDATTPPPTPVPAVDVRVLLSSDDAEERVSDGSMYVSSSDLELTNDAGYRGQQVVGIRFQSVTVPQGATITDAYIEFVTNETDSEATSLVFYGQAIDDAPTFTFTDYDVSGRTKTTASVAWENVPAWNTVGETHQTPALSPIVQEIVDRGGWSSGSAMAFIVAGSGQRTARSYDWDADVAPLLHVAYATCDDYDFSQNGYADVIDIMMAAVQWGTANPTYDVNGSGEVDTGDLVIIAGCWQHSATS